MVPLLMQFSPGPCLEYPELSQEAFKNLHIKPLIKTTKTTKKFQSNDDSQIYLEDQGIKNNTYC